MQFTTLFCWQLNKIALNVAHESHFSWCGKFVSLSKLVESVHHFPTYMNAKCLFTKSRSIIARLIFQPHIWIQFASQTFNEFCFYFKRFDTGFTLIYVIKLAMVTTKKQRHTHSHNHTEWILHFTQHILAYSVLTI